jgi:hypothetical protein
MSYIQSKIYKGKQKCFSFISLYKALKCIFLTLYLHEINYVDTIFIKEEQFHGV